MFGGPSEGLLPIYGFGKFGSQFLSFLPCLNDGSTGALSGSGPGLFSPEPEFRSARLWLTAVNPPWTQRKLVARNMLAVLDNLHRLGFRHLDVKANNFMIDPTTLRVVLVDYDHITTPSAFRESRVVRDRRPRTRGYQDPLVHQYPEIAGDYLDIWSTGATMIEVLFGDVQACFPLDFWPSKNTDYSLEHWG